MHIIQFKTYNTGELKYPFKKPSLCAILSLEKIYSKAKALKVGPCSRPNLLVTVKTLFQELMIDITFSFTFKQVREAESHQLVSRQKKIYLINTKV